MKTFRCLYIVLFLLLNSVVFGQNFPWQRPLKYAWSSDGINFNTPAIFQDSSGVPSVIQWNGDTLICAFQWFRVPMNSPSWDKVAVKFSYDNGSTWTQPTPIVMHGIPATYQRAFDPTLVKINQDSLRIYFSSSETPPVGGLDSTVNTYSAKSADGVNYYFENNPRIDVLNNQVIDPAVIRFNNAWHYASPVGAPQDGAYHYVSPDGVNFLPVANIPSDNAHNWTGNYMVNDSSELRFYGSSQNFIWYNSSPNGGQWLGFVNTNVNGGDPTVLRIASNNYLMVYVGNPYPNSTIENQGTMERIHLYPNPTNDFLIIDENFNGKDYLIEIYNEMGELVQRTKTNLQKIEISDLAPGKYFLHVIAPDHLKKRNSSFVKYD